MNIFRKKDQIKPINVILNLFFEKFTIFSSINLMQVDFFKEKIDSQTFVAITEFHLKLHVNSFQTVCRYRSKIGQQVLQTQHRKVDDFGKICNFHRKFQGSFGDTSLKIWFSHFLVKIKVRTNLEPKRREECKNMSKLCEIVIKWLLVKCTFSEINFDSL